jgi:uncharacterized membrane protein
MAATGSRPLSKLPHDDVRHHPSWNPRGFARDRWIPTVFVAAFAAIYATLAVRLHLTFQTAGWDLGIFEQAIRNYASLHAPIAVLKGAGFNLLGDHFHPILMLIAPFYAVFPTPITLLIAQALLFAISAWPLINWAQNTLGRRIAAVVGIVYGLSFGLASAVGFDFHEIAFAVPLIAYSLSALGQRRLRAAALFAVPLVLVKEDIGATVVAMIGILIFLRGARRLGAQVAIFGVFATALEVGVILPLISGDGYGYWSRLSGHPLLTVLQTSASEKFATLVLTLAITGFAALLSPIALAAIPTLVWRFASNDPNYWGTDFHYSAILMPIMIAAMIDGLTRMDKRRVFGVRAVPAILVVALAVTFATVPSHALAKLARPPLWSGPPQAAVLSQALKMIPHGVTVAASDNLVPQLTSRDTVTLFGLHPLASTHPQWIVVDPESTRHFVVTRAREQESLVEAEHAGYKVRLHHSDITVLQLANP